MEQNVALSTLLLQIKGKYSQMNPAMKQIADYVISDRENVAYININQLAEASGVSIASVTRFVKEFDFANYKSFQFELAKSLSPADNSSANDGSDDLSISFEYAGTSLHDGSELISRKVFQSNIQMLRDTMQILDYELIDKVAGMICTAGNIVVFGVGRSYLSAESVRTRLYRLGISCLTYCDVHEQLVAATTCKENDLVIGISNYGRSASIIKSMELARKRGCTTIGITSASDSPLAKGVDHCIYTAYNFANLEYRNKNRSYEPACENILQMVVIDCIYMNVALRQNKNCIDDFFITAEEQERERIN